MTTLSIPSLAALALLSLDGGDSTAEKAEPRVVVLAVEGLHADRAVAMMDAGELPHLAALARDGGMNRVRPTPGVEAPTIQVSLFTGVSPAEHGAVGYIERVLGSETVYPYFGFLSFEDLPNVRGTQLSAALEGGIGTVKARNDSAFVWEIAARSGKRAVALRAPQTAGRSTVDGARVLFGAGLFDARGTVGDWFLYTNDPDELLAVPNGRDTATAGTVFALEGAGPSFASAILGPEDFVRAGEVEHELGRLHAALNDPALDYRESLKLIERNRSLEEERSELRAALQLPLSIVVDESTATIGIGDESQTLAVGEWSALFRPVFELTHGVRVHALTRVKLLATEPHVRLYVHRLDLDPEHVSFRHPVSAPPSFSVELASRFGAFETYGWPTATMPYKDGEVDEATLIESASYTFERESELLLGVLQDDDWELLVSTFSGGAHLQYTLTGIDTPSHPRHAVGGADVVARFLDRDVRAGDAVDAYYAAFDDLVGETRAALGPEDVLLVVSPNGTVEFTRQVLLNNWLAEHGYLTADPSKHVSSLQSVDWEGTRAYAVGLAGVFVNLEGREPHGTVPLAEADALLEEIASKLLAERDPETGAPIVSAIFTADSLGEGEHSDRLPDLTVGFAPPFRTAWTTTLGGIHIVDGELGPFLVENDKRWTGEHHSIDPAAVEGIMLANVPLSMGTETLDLRVFAPTVLELLGVPIPAEMDLAPLALSER